MLWQYTFLQTFFIGRICYRIFHRLKQLVKHKVFWKFKAMILL